MKENFIHAAAFVLAHAGLDFDACVAQDLCAFAGRLEKATLDTIEGGEMTKDLALITSLPDPVVLNSEDFIKAIAKRL